MKGIVIKPADRAEWLQYRTKGIGSSEVGTILGLNPFETPYQLWRRKKGIDAPKAENFAMRAGHYLEDAVSKFYSDATGRSIIKNSAGDWLIVDRERDYLRVSPDRLFWADPHGKHNDANKGICECKTTQLTVDADNVPLHWYCQLQYQLGVAGLTDGALAWLTQGRDFGYKNITFDADFYDYIVEHVEEFWCRYIIGDEEPAAYTVDDICIKYPRHNAGEIVEVEPDIVAACAQLKDLKADIATLTKNKSQLEDKIKMAIGEAEGISDCDGRVLATWKAAKDSQKFDEKAFAAANPTEYGKYLVTRRGARMLLIK